MFIHLDGTLKAFSHQETRNNSTSVFGLKGVNYVNCCFSVKSVKYDNCCYCLLKC